MSLLPKSEQDCVFFLQGICSKTDCEYRHCEACIANLNVCPDWQNGKPCSKPDCTERHSNKHLANSQGFVKMSPNPEIPCKYNLNCQRPDCIFKHTGPRYIDTQQQRSFFPRPMSMTFRPRPQTADGAESAVQPTNNGQPQPVVSSVQSSNPPAPRPGQNRPSVQRPQARPNQFTPQPQATNQNVAGKSQLQIAGLSSRQNQNPVIRPVHTQAQAQNVRPVRPVRPTNKVRPISERLSLPDGNNNTRNSNQNNIKVSPQAKAGPTKSEKSRLRPPPASNSQARVVQIEKSKPNSGPSFGDPLTIEQIRAMKQASKVKAANQTSAATSQTSIPADNVQEPSSKASPVKLAEVQTRQPVQVQNVQDPSLKRAISETKEEKQPLIDLISIDDMEFDDYSQLNDEILEFEKSNESAPEPKKTKIDAFSAQSQPTTTTAEQPAETSEFNGDIDYEIPELDPAFLAELENF